MHTIKAVHIIFKIAAFVDVVYLVEKLPSIHKVLNLISMLHKLSMVRHASNPNALQVLLQDH